MNNEKHINKKPPMRGPGPGPGVAEKPKDFKNAILRLIQNLKSWHALIIFSLVLACLGSILSIVAPNRLSDLTDEISKGLVLNQSNLEKISNKITSNLSEDQMKSIMPDLLDVRLDQNVIMEISTSESISVEDKLAFQNTIASMSNEGSLEDMVNLLNLPESILNIVLPNSMYQEIEITTSDKIQFIEMMSSGETKDASQIVKLPTSIQQVLFPTFIFEGRKIKTEDQITFLTTMSNIKEDASSQEIYQAIDTLPETIQKSIEPNMNMDQIKKIAFLLVCLYLASALFTYLESISMTDVSNKFAKKLRSSISTKINQLPLKYFDNHMAGDILSRVTNDVDTIAQSMNQSLASLVSSVTLFIGSLIMMFATNWIMAITAIVSSLIGFVFMSMILGKSQKYFTQRQVELGKLNGHIEEVYSGLNVVKAYNGKRESDLKFDELNYNVYECNRKSQFLSGLMMPLMSFIGNFGYVAVCIVGALLVINSSITFGVIVAFIMYVRLFTSPLSQIAQAMTSLQSTAAASERVFEFLDEKEMEDESHKTKVLEKEKVKGQIEFEHVKFGYDKDKTIIKDFNAIAKPGQKIAIVGPTGAGKTTMVNLLMRFYEINSGDIKIDGVSTKELTRENIHELFTMVLQDTWVFDGTIKENIIYNRKNITDEQVKEVCKTVGIHHFIKTLSDGYDSKLSDNDTISAGQKQLITIARGMLEDAPFLILDEATSNVDTRTEELVQKAMDKLTEGKTSFIIAHRLSTIKNADLILVMKEGNIIETGNHDELIAKNGFYAELYNSQFKK